MTPPSCDSMGQPFKWGIDQTQPFLCIAPGLRGTGWAWFNLEDHACSRTGPKTGIVRGSGGNWQERVESVVAQVGSKVLTLYRVCSAVIEVPELTASSGFGGDRKIGKGRLSHAAQMQYLADRLCSMMDSKIGVRPHMVFPRDWQGWMPSGTRCERILEIWPGCAAKHQALDAVGMGLASQGRLL